MLVSQDENIWKDTKKNPFFLYSMPSYGLFKPHMAPCWSKPGKHIKGVNNVTLWVSCVTLKGLAKATFVQMINPLNYEKV